jgi:hypothetical protein
MIVDFFSFKQKILKVFRIRCNLFLRLTILQPKYGSIILVLVKNIITICILVIMNGFLWTRKAYNTGYQYLYLQFTFVFNGSFSNVSISVCKLLSACWPWLLTSLRCRYAVNDEWHTLRILGTTLVTCSYPWLIKLYCQEHRPHPKDLKSLKGEWKTKYVMLISIICIISANIN